MKARTNGKLLCLWKCNLIDYSAPRAIAKFDWQLGRYEPSYPSTTELHAFQVDSAITTIKDVGNNGQVIGCGIGLFERVQEQEHRLYNVSESKPPNAVDTKSTRRSQCGIRTNDRISFEARLQTTGSSCAQSSVDHNPTISPQIRNGLVKKLAATSQ